MHVVSVLFLGADTHVFVSCTQGSENPLEYAKGSQFDTEAVCSLLENGRRVHHDLVLASRFLVLLGVLCS